MSPFIKDFTGTGAYVALSATYLGFKGTLTASVANASDITIKDPSGNVTTLAPTEYILLDGCDISKIQILGNGLVLKAQGVTSTGWK